MRYFHRSQPECNKYRIPLPPSVSRDGKGSFDDGSGFRPLPCLEEGLHADEIIDGRAACHLPVRRRPANNT
jgi:hypothetical protein